MHDAPRGVPPEVSFGNAFRIIAVAGACFGTAAVAHLQTDDPLGVLRSSATCANWPHLHFLRLLGQYDAGGLRYHFVELLDTRTGRYSVSWITRNGVAGGSGFNGSEAWSEDLSGASHFLNAPFAHALALTQAWLARRAWCASGQSGAHVHADGNRNLNGRSLEVVQVTPSGGAPVEMWIDSNTNLPYRTELQFSENRQIDTFSDWRAFHGALLPLRLSTYDPEDRASETWTTTSIASLNQPTVRSFNPPLPPNDAAISGGAHDATVPLDVEDDKPLVGVRINGQGPFPFVLDSGGHILITRATARDVGLHGIGSSYETNGNTLNGESFARIATIQIGRASLRNQVVPIVNFGFRTLERGPHRPKAGWLGLQLFERFTVTMNSQEQTVTLTPTSETLRPRGAYLPITFVEHTPQVACRIDGRPGECMIDTGNQGDTIIEGYWAKRMGLAGRFRNGLAVGDNTYVSRATIQFGPFTLKRELVDYSPPELRGSEDDRAAAAILSEDILRRYVMTIDFERNAVWFKPIPGAKPLPFDRSGLEADKEQDGSFVVWYVVPGTPASQAGLKAGARIIAIDGRPSRDYSGADLWILGCGPSGSGLVLTIANRASSPHQVVLRLREYLP